MREKEFFILASGGYLPKPTVQKIEIKEAEMDEDFDNFEEFIEYTLEDAVAEFEQRFAKAIILTSEQAKEIAKILQEN